MKKTMRKLSVFILLSVSNLLHSEEVPDWAVRCDNDGDKRCYLVQNVFLAENQQRLAGLAIRSEGDGYLILISTPLGVELSSGARIQIDSAAPLTLSYQTCSPQGCHGVLMLDKEHFKPWKRAKTLTVNYQDTTGRRIGVPFSLKDFIHGIDQLKSSPRSSTLRPIEVSNLPRYEN